jgi:hypothetical protein
VNYDDLLRIVPCPLRIVIYIFFVFSVHSDTKYICCTGLVPVFWAPVLSVLLSILSSACEMFVEVEGNKAT